MYNFQDPSGSSMNILGDSVSNERKPRHVYLQGAERMYQNSNLTKVAPAPNPISYQKEPMKAFLENKELDSAIYNTLKPTIFLLRAVGVFPIGYVDSSFRVTAKWMIYSVFIFTLVVGYIGYIKWDKVEMIKSAEGRFEEAVIDYLFTVYLLPIVINPIIWYEARKQAKVLSDFVFFEKLYNSVADRKLSIFLGNKPLMISIIVPLISSGSMVVTHITMVHFRFFKVIPYCYINTVIYVIGAAWCTYSEVIGRTASVIADDFQVALKHIGPSARVADYRSLWMMLSRLIRDTGNSWGYSLTFLCLYLFLIITLTIYGLLSQLQDGLGVKDIGLTVTAGLACALLFFMCNEAHYASNCVRVRFQKKLLLVELSWMNDDAQQEITMFLRATEMNPTDMSLGGFFDVNRNLFKSLIATMVTYLVVLLQFQISIPEDVSSMNNTAVSITTRAPQ